VIVGGQSSGKSSLLQSLTGIPFPVDSGCCTRFPTRIVSRRTELDSDDSFRITIDPAEVNVPGLDPASDNIKNYECSGKILTKERFAKVIDEVHYELLIGLYELELTLVDLF
jgi:GTPase SAR1 family protein